MLFKKMIELEKMVRNMKLKNEEKEMDKILEKIQEEKDLTNKCIYVREYLSPQSTYIETIIKKDLLIGKKINEISGDGHKDGKNYEIKYSGHGKKSKINFVQIRPDHNIDYYILIAYNMYYDDKRGKAFVFKIPSEKFYKLVIEYGGYAHGTHKNLGKIDENNFKGRNCEYSLRCEPNSKKGKKFELWKKMIEFETEYLSENF